MAQPAAAIARLNVDFRFIKKHGPECSLLVQGRQRDRMIFFQSRSRHD
jgi:hypothetical protein